MPCPVSRTAIRTRLPLSVTLMVTTPLPLQRLNTVNNGVFHQRLDQQAWDHAVDLFINIVNDRQLIAKARLLDGDVIFDLIQLFFDVDLLVVF